MTRMKRMVAASVLTLLTLVVFAIPAMAYVATEYGTKSCGGSYYDVNTAVRADGGHRHTILHSTTTYADQGYVYTSYKASSYDEASYSISGGIGYYDYATSRGYCG